MKQVCWFTPIASLLVFLAVLAGNNGLVVAGTHAATLEERVNKLEAGQSAINAGDNAWLLTSSALVLMMTAPGLTLFYGGLVRSKNVLATMMHSMFLMGLVSLLWMVYGYSMAFAEGNGFCGNPMQYWLLRGVGAAPNADYAPSVPHESFMLFQLMFAIITPALISGAFAERMRFGAFVLFVFLWVTFIYFPLAHMVWGKGGWFNWALGGKVPVLDFAGGLVVHISSGTSALVCTLVLGGRVGYPQEPMPPHSVVLSLIGTGLLWVGWFGFNAGSALGAGELATRAFAATHFSAATAALSWGASEWYLKGRPSVLGVASGMVAGLATITPAAGFVNVPSAVLIGLVAGVGCYMAVTRLKSAFGYDDSLEVFGVHGVGSTVGMLMCGWLATAEVNPPLVSSFKVGGTTVSLAGGASQFANQLRGVVFTIALAGVGTFIILKLVGAVIPLRVDEEEEDQGLDLTQHGEQACND
jgi:Amt family ammonium transporter